MVFSEYCQFPGNRRRTKSFCRFIACKIDPRRWFACGLSEVKQPSSVFKTVPTRKESRKYFFLAVHGTSHSRFHVPFYYSVRFVCVNTLKRSFLSKRVIIVEDLLQTRTHFALEFRVLQKNINRKHIFSPNNRYIIFQ